MEGLYSIKSDIFSFGVLTLEIITGKKNSNFNEVSSLNLVGQVSNKIILCTNLFTFCISRTLVIFRLSSSKTAFFFRYGTYGQKGKLWT